VAASLIESGAMGVGAVVAVALGVCVVVGLWNGLLVAVFRIQPLVGTLVLMVAGRGVAMLITEGRRITIQESYPGYDQFVYIGNGFLLYVPLAVTIVVVTWAATHLLTRRTALGMFIESVGDNDTASRYAGVNARAVKLAVYTYSALLAGIAGLIYASNIRTADASKAGLYLELDAIMAVVIGGTPLTGGRFCLLGSVVGALLIQTLTTTMLMHGLSSDQALVPKALVVVAVCLLQSEQFRTQLMRVVRAVQPDRAAEKAAEGDDA
jgi:simple sugar transport system permease protein